MNEAPIEIDPVELGDIAQPTNIAHEIHRQLRKQFGSAPRRIPLAGIADAVGIAGIKEFDTDRFEGTLVIQGGVGAIGLRRGLRPGRRNFTLGHELGHFLIPHHRFRRGRFECATGDINKRGVHGGNRTDRPPSDRIEIEANEFSAALLVPMPEFREERRRLGTGCDIGHVRQLADLFAVSQEMMSRIYVNASDEKVAVIISHNGVIRRIIIPTNFPYLGIRSGDFLPPRALARTFKPANGKAASDLCDVLTDTWLEQRGSVSAIYEQILLQENGWTTTLLVVDEVEADDEEDDQDWNRRSIRR